MTEQSRCFTCGTLTAIGVPNESDCDSCWLIGQGVADVRPGNDIHGRIYPSLTKLAERADRSNDRLIALVTGPAQNLLPIWDADHSGDTFPATAVRIAGEYLANPTGLPTDAAVIASDLAAAYQRLWRHAYIMLTTPDA